MQCFVQFSNIVVVYHCRRTQMLRKGQSLRIYIFSKLSAKPTKTNWITRRLSVREHQRGVGWLMIRKYRTIRNMKPRKRNTMLCWIAWWVIHPSLWLLFYWIYHLDCVCWNCSKYYTWFTVFLNMQEKVLYACLCAGSRMHWNTECGSTMYSRHIQKRSAVVDQNEAVEYLYMCGTSLSGQSESLLMVAHRDCYQVSSDQRIYWQLMLAGNGSYTSQTSAMQTVCHCPAATICIQWLAVCCSCESWFAAGCCHGISVDDVMWGSLLTTCFVILFIFRCSPFPSSTLFVIYYIIFLVLHSYHIVPTCGQISFVGRQFLWSYFSPSLPSHHKIVEFLPCVLK